jgi:large conductance mechanosensitive channel
MCKSEISINACRCPMCTTILDAKAVQEFESKTGV